ncbi:hypothetical protein LCGC14_1037590 [marine sediment metagenome]|uniref:Uncharacterized protein n=1 Tax=marine sediment metagenome TaxID=412755 RepID=A0A0F9QB04_9ZZZZ
MRILKYIQLLIIVLIIVGEIKCIYKAVNCNWDPIGKAEVIYTVAAFTGLGSIVGWFDIEDK